jgi:hypothetical protein
MSMYDSSFIYTLPDELLYYILEDIVPTLGFD